MAILAAPAALDKKISVDDFGTGYASLSYLNRLPVHQVKLDKSFVSLMDVSASDAAVVLRTPRQLGCAITALASRPGRLRA